MAKGAPFTPQGNGLLLGQGGPLLGIAKGTPCQDTRAPCQVKGTTIEIAPLTVHNGPVSGQGAPF